MEHYPSMIKKSILFAMILLAFHASARTVKLTGITNKTVEKAMELNLKSLLDSKTFQNLEKKHPHLAQKMVLENITAAAEPFGYFSSSAAPIGRNLYRVKLGPVTTIRHVHFKLVGPGEKLLQRSIERLIHKNLIPGKKLRTSFYERVKDRVIHKAEKKGFIKAYFKKSTVKIYRNCHCADIDWELETKKRYYFGKLTFSKTSYYDSFLARFAPFRFHSPYSSEKLVQFEQNLSGSVYFNSVSVTPTITDNPLVPVDIQVNEKPAQEYTIGAGFGTDTGMRARASAQLLRLTPTGHTLNFSLQASQVQNSLQMQYVIPGLNPVNQQTILSATINELNYPIGESKYGTVALTYYNNVNHWQTAYGLNLLFEDFNYNNQPTQRANLLYPSFNITYLKTQSPLFSKKGIRLNLSALAASDTVLSSHNMVQGILTGRTALWFPTHSRLFLQAQAGQTIADNINDLPLSLQPTLGGTENLVAYNFQSIGPGKYILFASAEWQQETKKDWFVTVNYGLGDVYDPTPLQWKRNIGVGLMYVSPIGPIKVGVAKAIDRVGQPYKVVFNIGPDI